MLVQQSKASKTPTASKAKLVQPSKASKNLTRQVLRPPPIPCVDGTSNERLVDLFEWAVVMGRSIQSDARHMFTIMMDRWPPSLLLLLFWPSLAIFDAEPTMDFAPLFQNCWLSLSRHSAIGAFSCSTIRKREQQENWPVSWLVRFVIFFGVCRYSSSSVRQVATGQSSVESNMQQELVLFYLVRTHREVQTFKKLCALGSFECKIWCVYFCF
jgi:hypothetical protein